MAAKVDLSHIRTVEETLEEYKVLEEEGLSKDRVLQQRKKFGYNGESVFTFKEWSLSCKGVIDVPFLCFLFSILFTEPPQDLRCYVCTALPMAVVS